MIPRILIVAGSDSSGGAGIQADVKTVTSLGGYAATAITALTAQDSRGVKEIYDVPAEFVVLQMELFLDDIGADVIKTGMLNNAGIVLAIAELLTRKYFDVTLVIDPVMVAKGGKNLSGQEAQEAMVTKLLSRCSLVTPNIPEAEILSGLTIDDEKSMQQAGEKILAMGAKAVLVKGGHLSGQIVTDILVTEQAATRFSSPRILSRHTHGTGCTLASAIAEGMGRGLSLPVAIERARGYLLHAIMQAPGFGAGHGPVFHGHNAGSKIPPTLISQRGEICNKSPPFGKGG